MATQKKDNALKVKRNAPKPYPVNADEKLSIAADFEMPYKVYQSFYADDISLLARSKKGLSAKAALDFLSLSGFTQDEFQETFKTTVKTIQNHVKSDLTLDAALSEKLLKSF